MIAIDYNKIDKFVAGIVAKGVDARWDGWNVVVFRPNPSAIRNPRGAWRNGAYGYETVVRPNSKGKWLFKPDLVNV